MCEKKYMLASVYFNLYTAFSWGFHLDLVSKLWTFELAIDLATSKDASFGYYSLFLSL